MSKTLETEEALKMLMNIFKTKAAAEEDPTKQVRNSIKKAAAQRTENEENEVVQASEAVTQQRVVIPEPVPNLIPRTQPDSDTDDATAEPIVSYPESEDWETLDGPAQNTRLQTQARTITQECIMATIEMSQAPITARNAAQRKYQMQLINEIASVVLDVETGEMLEFRHLMQNPKYRQPWGHSFGNDK